MSEPSSWPLSNEALRVRVPKYMLSELLESPLSAGLFPTAIGYYPNAKSHQMQRVEHDDFIVLYCADGRGVLKTNQSSWSVERGDLFILPPGTAHHYKADRETPWSLFWCHFRGSLALDLYEHIDFDDNELVIRQLNYLSLLARFNDLVEIARNSYSIAGFIHAGNQLRQILTLIERLKHTKQKTQTGIILPKIQQYMRENLNKHLSLEDLALLSHLSKYHFSRKYQLLTGFSPVQHFIHLKMEHACFLLDQADMSISEVAFELGYDDALYFSRVFRKINNISPSQYRKKLDC